MNHYSSLAAASCWKYFLVLRLSSAAVDHLYLLRVVGDSSRVGLDYWKQVFVGDDLGQLFVVEEYCLFAADCWSHLVLGVDHYSVR